MITGLLLLLPAALLFVSLILGHYPGEETLEWARYAVRDRRPRPLIALLPTRRPPRRIAHGGALLGGAFAARPPPACG